MTILAVGDSITSGFSKLEVGGVPSHSWAKWVAMVTGEDLTARVLPGGTSRAIRSKFVGGELDEYSLALVYVGVNNVMSWRNLLAFDLADDLRAILSWVSPHAARVAVMTYPEDLGRAWAILPYGPRRRYRIDYCNRIVRELAREFGATVIEAPVLRAPGMAIGDGVHPNSVGHRAMADAALATLGMPSTLGLDAPRSEGVGYLGSQLRTAVRAAVVRPPQALAGWARSGFKWRLP
jgi:lysophospholipase L1-like esterase